MCEILDFHSTTKANNNKILLYWIHTHAFKWRKGDEMCLLHTQGQEQRDSIREKKEKEYLDFRGDFLLRSLLPFSWVNTLLPINLRD